MKREYIKAFVVCEVRTIDSKVCFHAEEDNIIICHIHSIIQRKKKLSFHTFSTSSLNSPKNLLDFRLFNMKGTDRLFFLFFLLLPWLFVRSLTEKVVNRPSLCSHSHDDCWPFLPCRFGCRGYVFCTDSVVQGFPSANTNKKIRFFNMQVAMFSESQTNYFTSEVKSNILATAPSTRNKTR